LWRIQIDRVDQQHVEQEHEEAVMDDTPPIMIEGATIIDAFRANVPRIPQHPAMRHDPVRDQRTSRGAPFR